MRTLRNLLHAFVYFALSTSLLYGAKEECRRALDPSELYALLSVNDAYDLTEMMDVARPGDKLIFMESRQPRSADCIGASTDISYWPNKYHIDHWAHGDALACKTTRDGKILIELKRIFLDNVIALPEGEVGIPRVLPAIATLGKPLSENYRTSVIVMTRLVKKLLGPEGFGQANQIFADRIFHFETILELDLRKRAWQRDHLGMRFPESMALDFLKQTSLFHLLEEVIESTGHQIKSAEITGGQSHSLDFFAGRQADTFCGYRTPERISRNSAKFGSWQEKARKENITLRLGDSVHAGFDIHFEVTRQSTTAPRAFTGP